MGCGVFAAYDFNHNSIFPSLYLGSKTQNHRGHQSWGFVTYDERFHREVGLDLIPKIKRNDIKNWLDKLPGYVGLSNVTYTTFRKKDEESLKRATQPIVVETENRKIAMSFNGHVVNYTRLEEEIRDSSPGFSYESDVELICKKLLIELMKDNDLVSSVKTCMEEVEGAFSVAGIDEDGQLFAFRDPYGIRPYCCGYSKDKSIYALSSESVGLDINRLKYHSEIKPGELVLLTENGFERKQVVKSNKRSFCGFEFAYFARPDSRMGNSFVYEVREEFGRNLAREYPDVMENVDMIISMPETGNDAAYGLHEETGVRWERATRRHRFMTERAFILLPEERQETIERKINILGEKLKGKNVAVTEDSIVRGDTTMVIVNRMRRMGVKDIHLFITFPRIIGPCFYGIDMATYEELIGARCKPDQIAEKIGATSVNYQSVDGFVKSTGLKRDELCLGCVTGEYPTPLAQELADKMREKVKRGYKETKRIYE